MHKRLPVYVVGLSQNMAGWGHIKKGVASDEKFAEETTADMDMRDADG